ncbi:MAG: hypothetical protein MUF34_07310, partial [Polyangiaceae bacterium]|jgi:hypothetical protein|nr:hypothetical protein [Polyangiaceae bacterium]
MTIRALAARGLAGRGDAPASGPDIAQATPSRSGGAGTAVGVGWLRARVSTVDISGRRASGSTVGKTAFCRSSSGRVALNAGAESSVGAWASACVCAGP